jgi:hypothetical protein
MAPHKFQLPLLSQVPSFKKRWLLVLSLTLIMTFSIATTHKPSYCGNCFHLWVKWHWPQEKVTTINGRGILCEMMGSWMILSQYMLFGWCCLDSACWSLVTITWEFMPYNQEGSSSYSWLLGCLYIKSVYNMYIHLIPSVNKHNNWLWLLYILIYSIKSNYMFRPL